LLILIILSNFIDMIELSLDKAFKSLADPTRREVLKLLSEAPTALSISTIVDHFTGSRQAITKHLNVLNQANLIEFEQRGRERFCSPNYTPLKEVNRWIQSYEQYWSYRIELLDKYTQTSGG